MHAFLICSKNKKTALDYAIGECKKNQIDKFDISIFTPHHSGAGFTFEKAIGIEDVRNLQKKIILKPIKSKTKAVILDGSNGFTMEAQNALLKILEEPPPHTIIYITSPNKNLLLPTILSRCKIITLKEEFYELSQEENTQYLNILISLSEKTIGDRLKIAQDVAKNKDNVIPWLEKMIVVAREEMVNHICHPERRDAPDGASRSEGSPDDSKSLKESQYLSILISLQKSHTILKTTNVNQRIALENLFLNL